MIGVPPPGRRSAPVFGAILGMSGRFDAADIPGADLTFSGMEEDRVGTRGRVLHGVGFRVRGLEALCQRLEGWADVTFDRPCEQDSATGSLGAELTDPLGHRHRADGGIGEYRVKGLLHV